MVIVKSSKKALAVGILSFVLPNALARLTTFALKHFLSMDKEILNVLPQVVMLLSMTSFPVVACFLDEFEILDSEIGRLACSSSMVCDICYWSVVSFNYTITSLEEMSPETSLGSFLSNGLLMSLILFGIRPGAIWMVENSPEGKPVKEIYVFAVFVALLICGLLGEVTGLTALARSIFLGLVILDGPPLGAALSDRRDCFVSVLLVPVFFTACALRLNVLNIQKLENVGIIHLVAFVALFGKVVGSILPPLLCRMPFRDALALGHIMSRQFWISFWYLIQPIRAPLIWFVLHLIKLVGRFSPLLIAHQPRGRLFSYKTLSEQIFSAFRKLEEHFGDRIIINCYKGISPYTTMYNDVCS
ncbi:unnamed protein product [Citrullus colocynthis]|uniref:Cation/H+ exchanger transmembrane domain-containing protein n=1 Tax=Citrullus colocynthis TaxID=252529 RepID=A0ABP0Y3R2_9ROSI